MNSDRSHNGPNRPRHNTGGRPPKSAQRPNHNNNSNRFMPPDEYIRTLERKNEELTAEIVSLRDLNFTHQLTIKEMRKELQGRPAAKTDKFSPRHNDPIRYDAHPQANTDRAYRNGARSDAIGMAIPVPSTIAPAPLPTDRKSFSGSATVPNPETAIHRSPASAVPPQSPRRPQRSAAIDAKIDAMVASALGFHI